MDANQRNREAARRRGDPDKRRPTRSSAIDQIFEVTPLLRPETSTVLLVDPCGEAPQDEQSRGGSPPMKMATLCRCANHLGVPVFASVLATPGQPKGVLPDGILQDDDARVSARTVLNPWDDDQLVAELAGNSRPRLILMGGWRDVTVVMAALSALAHGFDAHVVADCCPGLMQDPGAVALRRLVQAGVVPVTWQQVLFEWMHDRPQGLTQSFLRDVFGDETPPSQP